jgi:hypothetical protein
VGWVVTAAWAFALLVALGVLGLGAYQVSWRLRRLRGDLAALQGLQAEAQLLQTELESARRRAAAVRTGG